MRVAQAQFAETGARNQRLDFLVTSDFHRADAGFVIRRKPIYLDVQATSPMVF